MNALKYERYKRALREYRANSDKSYYIYNSLTHRVVCGPIKRHTAVHTFTAVGGKYHDPRYMILHWTHGPKPWEVK